MLLALLPAVLLSAITDPSACAGGAGTIATERARASDPADAPARVEPPDGSPAWVGSRIEHAEAVLVVSSCPVLSAEARLAVVSVAATVSRESAPSSPRAPPLC
jgi:hypothetical protein